MALNYVQKVNGMLQMLRRIINLPLDIWNWKEIPEFKTWIVKNGLNLGSPNKPGYLELEKEKD